MNEREVREMAQGGLFKNERLRGSIEETHISWVVIAKKYAFKIKKPVRLDFLDFSTLELRKRYCEREVMLNSRFSTIYLSVQPIRFVDKQWIIGGKDEGEVIDYCVVMKRMAVAKRMDNYFRCNKVSKGAIETLAIEIAAFHKKASKIFTPFDIANARKTFNDIATIKDFVSQEVSINLSETVSRSIDWSDTFLVRHQERMRLRIEQGFQRDVHGDLHSGNIFLYRKPVLFDCIEFNNQYRQIDILYDIAFLCMDMEAFQQGELSEYFISEYKKHVAAFLSVEDDHIFRYFKCLRANIRAKVHAVSACQADSLDEKMHHIAETKKYLRLMQDYVGSL